jgi:DegV family protein with EDD domain
LTADSIPQEVLMANVQIITDSVACLPKDLVDKYRIRVVPAAIITYDGTDYIEGETLSATEAYELIKKDPDKFTTAAITPGRLLEEYQKVGAGVGEILHIALSSALSATFKTAGMASELFKQESPKTAIRVLDAKTVASPQGLIVLAAARAAAKGLGLDEVAAAAEEARARTKGLMMLDTLRYIYRTGRMSKFSSRLASLFNIKPINRVTDEGTIEFVDKVRDRESGYKRLIELIENETETKDLHFMLSHAAVPEAAEQLGKMLKDQFNCLELIVGDFSAIMGYGSGPGSLFVGFHPALA